MHVILLLLRAKHKGGMDCEYDKRINLKLQFPLLHIIPAGEDFYF